MDPKIIEKALKFRNDRNWKQFHTPRNLAISISLEANELLEHFQWVDSEEAVQENKEAISEELADVMLYCIYMADALQVDLDQIIDSKIDKNAKKYPVEKAYGSAKKYTEL